MSADIGRTGRPAKILTAARGLVLRQGFRKTSMSQVAAAARVAKGTAYSYWPSKESLFLELLTWTFRTSMVEIESAVGRDPEQARPGRLMLQLVRVAYEQDLVRALLGRDEDILGDLLDNPDSAALVAGYGAAALITELIPIWRSNDMADSSVDPGEQAEALKLLALGYLTGRGRADITPETAPDDAVFGAAVERVLWASTAPVVGYDRVEAVAAAAGQLLQQRIGALTDTLPDLGAGRP